MSALRALAFFACEVPKMLLDCVTTQRARPRRMDVRSRRERERARER